MLPVAFHRALGFSWLHYLLESLLGLNAMRLYVSDGEVRRIRALWRLSARTLQDGRVSGQTDVIIWDQEGPLFENSWNSANGLISTHARIFKRTLTFSQEVLKEPPGVVLWILQMDVGSPPGGWSVVWGLDCHTKHTKMYSMRDTAWITPVYHVGIVGVMQTDQGIKMNEIFGVWGTSALQINSICLHYCCLNNEAVWNKYDVLGLIIFIHMSHLAVFIFDNYR